MDHPPPTILSVGIPGLVTGSIGDGRSTSVNGSGWGRTTSLTVEAPEKPVIFDDVSIEKSIETRR